MCPPLLRRCRVCHGGKGGRGGGGGGGGGPISGLMGDLKSLFFGPDMTMTTADLGQIGQGAPVSGIAGGPVRVEGLDEIDELERKAAPQKKKRRSGDAAALGMTKEEEYYRSATLSHGGQGSYLAGGRARSGP